MTEPLVIEGRAGVTRVTLRPADGYVEATYERLGGNGWLRLRRTEMRCEWDCAIEYARKIINAP